jgi:acyl dehydratase
MNSTGLFETPGQKRYFEDYVEGETYTFGTASVNEAEVIDFAKQYDPQVFHMDPEKAKDSIYGSLIASGWHTAAMTMNMLTRYYLSDVSSLGSPGMDSLRWIAPVRPGDTLSVRTTVTQARRSQSKPDRGIVKSHIEVINQNGAVVMDFTPTNFVACR